MLSVRLANGKRAMPAAKPPRHHATPRAPHAWDEALLGARAIEKQKALLLPGDGCKAHPGTAPPEGSTEPQSSNTTTSDETSMRSLEDPMRSAVALDGQGAHFLLERLAQAALQARR